MKERRENNRVGRSIRQVSEEEIRVMLLQSKNYKYEEDVSAEQKLSFNYLFNEFDKMELIHNERQLKTLKLINRIL